jgi:hypothetical protein
MKNGSHLSRMIAISSCVGVMSLVVASGCGKGRGPFLSNVPTAPGAGTGLGGAGKGPAPVNLGTAGNFVLLAQSTITNVPPSAITGNVGLSPAAAQTYLTGFSVSGTTCTEISGIVYIVAGTISPACAVADSSGLTKAIGDKGIAYTDAAGRAPDYTELGAGDISGMTLSAGTYKWSSPVVINSDVTLSGGPNDVWIFQVGQTLTLAPAVHVNLVGGALPQNIYWQVAGSVILDTTTAFKGTLISQTSIATKSGATVNGKLLAGTAITLISTTVSP